MPLDTPTSILCNRERATAIMEQQGLDALCVTDARNVYYLSNFDSSLLWNWANVAFAILPRETGRPPTLILSGLDLPFLIDEPTWMPEVRPYAIKPLQPGETQRIDFAPLVREGAELGAHERRALELFSEMRGMMAPNSETALGQTLRDLDLGNARIAFDDMRLAGILAGGMLPELQLVDGRDILRDIRMVKTEPEIHLMREAAWRNEQALGAAIEATRPGIPWGDVVKAYHVRMIELGGTPKYLMRGAGEFAQVRVGLLDYDIRPGDIVMYDAFGQYKHYSGDVGRTAYLGQAPEEVKQRYSALRQGWQTGCEQVRPGMSSTDLQRLIADAVHEAGFREYGAPTPHSVGLEHFDHPQQRGFYQEFVIPENAVLNVDMPFFEYGWGAIHLEDTIVVRGDGVEYLTSNQTGLIEIPV